MNEKFADIIVEISHEKVDRPFQYLIPENLMDKIEIGASVIVPFGKGNKLIQGYVIDISSKCNFERNKIKEIDRLVEKGVSAESNQIKLARFIKEQYGSTMIQALKVVVPAKKTVKKVEKKTIILKGNREEIITFLGECKRKKQVAKVRLLEELLQEEKLPYDIVLKKLMISSSTLRSVENAGYIKIEVSESYRNPVNEKEQKIKEKILSKEQEHIVAHILDDMNHGKEETYLIHGITGSGKTHVYIKLIEEVVAKGKQAIVLIPEIALTYQTLLRFYHQFGDRVSIMNSGLSQGEKYDQCERAKWGEIDVIIGPRSALFVPFPNIGVIIIDEEHESSYKSESMPKYHAREIAREVANMHGASLVLGSATPSLESYFLAKKGEIQLFEMTKRLTGGTLPQISVIDLREELRQGNRSIFSEKLKSLMEDRYHKKEQTILFINRRGFAGFISCRACGEVVKCPHCEVSLSEHKNGKMMCHYCGYETLKITTCPKCSSKYVSGFRAGTQQIEEKLKELFPQIKTLRMDADTTKTKGSYEKILTQFGNGEADVLIGTQMIVKGHDFPNVTLVGVLAADLSLAMNDYRAGERTFQLLTQAAGRAGRGSIPGEVVIQTYQPDNYAITYAANQDFIGFYEEEILYREMAGYPPSVEMLAVQIYSDIEEYGKEVGEKMVAIIKTSFEEQIIGPAPASIGKINDIFRFVFYVKSQKYDKLVSIKDYLELWLQEVERKHINVQFDFNPMNTI